MCWILKLRVGSLSNYAAGRGLVASGDIGTYYQEERYFSKRRGGQCWWFRRSRSERVDQQQYTRGENYLSVLEISGLALHFSFLHYLLQTGMRLWVEKCVAKMDAMPKRLQRDKALPSTHYSEARSEGQSEMLTNGTK